ncbi:MAG TPA: hypothetical protein DDZ37_01235 [Spirochaetaceae bacterium]|nr:hypothetical protein [Spirochaetaceae bacterium]
MSDWAGDELGVPHRFEHFDDMLERAPTSTRYGSRVLRYTIRHRYWPRSITASMYSSKKLLLLLGISPYLQQVIKGIIIVGAVVFDMRKNARQK